jgi:hypothetical protein
MSAREKLRDKLLAKLTTLINEAFDELIEEEDVTGDQIAELLGKQLKVARPTKSSKPVPKTTRHRSPESSYAKLPQERTELVDWIKKLLEKRQKTKLGGDIKDEDKVFNIATQRFIKRSSCLQRNCTLREVTFENDTIGFTEGGDSPSKATSQQFEKFISLFEHPEDQEQVILKNLEKKPLTLTELKKFIQPTSLLNTLLTNLKEKDLIETEGKFYKLVEQDVENENEEEVEVEEEDVEKEDEEIGKVDKEKDVYNQETEDDD